MSRRPDPRAALAVANRRSGVLRNRNGRPDPLDASKPLPIRQVPLPAGHLVVGSVAFTAAYTIGECKVLVGHEAGAWHLSISHADRDPSWVEISQAWYRIVGPKLGPRSSGALILPRKDAYINLHPHCFQVHEIDGVAGGFQPEEGGIE
jgi:hypothetical protein